MANAHDMVTNTHVHRDVFGGLRNCSYYSMECNINAAILDILPPWLPQQTLLSITVTRRFTLTWTFHASFHTCNFTSWRQTIRWLAPVFFNNGYHNHCRYAASVCRMPLRSASCTVCVHQAVPYSVTMLYSTHQSLPTAATQQLRMNHCLKWLLWTQPSSVCNTASFAE